MSTFPGLLHPIFHRLLQQIGRQWQLGFLEHHRSLQDDRTCIQGVPCRRPPYAIHEIGITIMKQSAALILLAVLLVACTGFTIGLLYLPCYSSLCSEDFFLIETELHVATNFGLIGSIASFLILRAYSQWWRTLSTTYITQRPIPIFGHRLSIGGLALTVWIVGLVRTLPLAAASTWSRD